MSQHQELEHHLVSGSQAYGGQGKDAAAEGQQQRDNLVAQIGAVLGKSPDTVESHFQRQKNSGRGDQQNHDRNHFHAAPSHNQLGEVIDNEVLVAGEVVAEELADDVKHGLRVEHIADEPHQQDHEWEKRQDGIGGH